MWFFGGLDHELALPYSAMQCAAKNIALHEVHRRTLNSQCQCIEYHLM
jgi:hypothetical protein